MLALENGRDSFANNVACLELKGNFFEVNGIFLENAENFFANNVDFLNNV